MSSIYAHTQNLLRQRPDLALILIACLRLAEADNDSIFWGVSAQNLAQCTDAHPLARPLLCGILERVDRGRKDNLSALYRVRNTGELRRALLDMGYDLQVQLPGDFFTRHVRPHH
ncbi:MAG TPA: hypothetical protein VFB15_01415 [Candidatus Binataceae bacterium]|jgi:hypothetical protein|nr:hypothetical protein [Candidatus Binataceae bacterium]